MLDDSSSSSSDDDIFFHQAMHAVLNEDEVCEDSQPGGSVHGHLVLNRERHTGHMRLYQDYFSDQPTYGASYFRRRLV